MFNTRDARARLFACLLPLYALLAHGQVRLWEDTFHGGVVSGAFSIGDQNFGYGVLDMALPAGCTVRKAELFAFDIGGGPDASLSFQMGSIPILLNPSTASLTYGSIYGVVTMHRVDLSNILDPTVDSYLMDLMSTITTFKEFHLLVQYELPGAASITTDLFFCDGHSQNLETYHLQTSRPMNTDAPVAFGTMACYARDYWVDCEQVYVNGTELGRYYGRDYNSPVSNTFGASATFHYAYGVLEGVGDDDPDQAIDGGDVLSNIAALLNDNATSFHVSYRHCETWNPDAQGDNLVNLILLAYGEGDCDQQVHLGPDTLLCPGDSITLRVDLPGMLPLWSDGSSENQLVVHAPGTYWASGTLAGCPVAPDTVVVRGPAHTALDLGGPLLLCADSSAMVGVQAAPGVRYHWNDGDTNALRSVSHPGLYTLHATEGHCSLAADLQVVMVECAPELTMPNIFSPNGDGSNDHFAPIEHRAVAISHMVVRNRWGQELHRSRPPAIRWDGRTPDGSPVTDGVYFWSVAYTLPNGEHRTLHGTVTLLR